MSSTAFLSFAGTQHGGVLQPLEACLAAGRSLDAIYLCATSKTHAVAERIKAYCAEKNHPPVHILPYDPRQSDAEKSLIAAISAQHVIFNIEGGLNFAVSRMLLHLGRRCTHLLVSSEKTRILCHSLADDTQELLPPPPNQDVSDILQLQGVPWEKNELPISLCELCREGGVSLPSNRLENIRIGNMGFDLVWNDGSNKLCFLTNIYRERLENKEWLDCQRTLCQWATTRTASFQLYDRQIFAFCPTRESQEHLTEESRQKIQAVYVPEKALKKEAPARLQEIFSASVCKPSEQQISLPKVPGSRKVASDTLVLMLGKDAAPTLNAVESQPQANVIICHTGDDDMRQCAQRLRDTFRDFYPDRDLKTLETSLDGRSLPRQLIAGEGAQNLHVNITPGTKGQAAFLTLWAQRSNAAVWSLDAPDVRRLDGDGAASLPLMACDPLHLLRLRCPDLQEQDFKDNLPAYDALLQSMRAWSDAGVEWSVRQNRTVGNITLRSTGAKTWEIVLPSGESYNFTEKGGEWLEGLTAYALTLMNARHVHARVRLPWSPETQTFLEKKHQEEQHRLDMDVLAAWKGNHLLVSCKSNPSSPIQEAAREACNVAHSVARFTLPALCHLGCREAGLLPIDNHDHVLVFGWRELCRPERLAGLFDQALEARRSIR